MVREPKMESFFANLSDEHFSLNKLADNRDGLEELFYYLEESHCRQVTDAIKNLSDDAGDYSRKNIVANLVRLYPLSQDLVHKILQDIPQSDYYFIEGFDVNEKVYKALKHILKDAQGKSVTTTKRFQEYQEDVEKLAKDAENMEQKAGQFQELRQRKRELEARIEELRRETDEKQINNKIAELEDEARSLEREKERQQARTAELHGIINDVKRELNAMKDNFDSDEDLELLGELLKNFPQDAED